MLATCDWISQIHARSECRFRWSLEFMLWSECGVWPGAWSESWLRSREGDESGRQSRGCQDLSRDMGSGNLAGLRAAHPMRDYHGYHVKKKGMTLSSSDVWVSPMLIRQRKERKKENIIIVHESQNTSPSRVWSHLSATPHLCSRPTNISCRLCVYAILKKSCYQNQGFGTLRLCDGWHHMEFQSSICLAKMLQRVPHTVSEGVHRTPHSLPGGFVVLLMPMWEVWIWISVASERASSVKT